MFRHGVLVERGSLLFFCAILLCEWFRMLKGGWTAFRVRVCHGWKEWFPPFSAMCTDFSSHRRANTGLNHVVRDSKSYVKQ